MMIHIIMIRMMICNDLLRIYIQSQVFIMCVVITFLYIIWNRYQSDSIIISWKMILSFYTTDDVSLVQHKH